CHVARLQVGQDAVHAVGDRRARRTTRRVGRAEHEVIDEELRAAVEQLRDGLLARLGLEAILLLERDPGQLAAGPGEPGAEPRVRLLARGARLGCGGPLFAGSDLVMGHFFLLVVVTAARLWPAPPMTSTKPLSSLRVLSPSPSSSAERGPRDREHADRAEEHA